jgi:DnaJ-domain-containing protein 1
MEKRGKERCTKASGSAIGVAYEDRSGVRHVVQADVLDASARGLGVQLREHLPSGTQVSVRGGPAHEGVLKARVLWCTPARQGGFRAGLEYLAAAAPPAAEEPSQSSSAQAVEGSLDYYEILQVNEKAEPETIHRVYRILAQRYHPDNQETGSEKQFRALLEAYTALSEPAARAAYDLRRNSTHRPRLRLFEQPGSDTGVDGERRKRLGVLAALYRKRVVAPESALLTVFEIEDLAGVPREHLEFAFWYLKEQGLVARSDNNRYQITIRGVDYAEANRAELPAVHVRLLSGPARQTA